MPFIYVIWYKASKRLQQGKTVLLQTKMVTLYAQKYKNTAHNPDILLSLTKKQINQSTFVSDANIGLESQIFYHKGTHTHTHAFL